MDIYPQDLGRIGYRVTLFLRAQTMDLWDPRLRTEATLRVPTPLTRLRRAWMGTVALPDETARQAKPAFALCRRAIWDNKPWGLGPSLFWTAFSGLGILSILGLSFDQMVPVLALVSLPVTYGSVVMRPRGVFRRLHRKLTTDDIEKLIQHVRDPLAQEFLALVPLILEAPPAEAATEKHVRQALFALGEAIEGLPPQITTAPQDDPAALQAQVEKLAAQTIDEQDPIVAASLERRVWSMNRRAQTAAHVAALLRRNNALRQEISEQIGALRISMAAFRIGGKEAVPELAGLADSIQRVAQEATALTTAHAEIDAALQAVPAPPETPAPLSIGLRPS